MLKRMVGRALPGGGGGGGCGRTVPASAGSVAASTTGAPTPQAGSAGAAPAAAWGARAPTREDLDERRCTERSFVAANDTTEADLWYLVDVVWLSEWKRFALRGGALPGPIRNEALVHPRTGKPRQGLDLVHHYRGVNGVVWTYWVRRYGGGPAVRRRQLDLYAAAAPEGPHEAALTTPAGGGASPLPLCSTTDDGVRDPPRSSRRAAGGAGAPRPGRTAAVEKASSRKSLTELLSCYSGIGRASRNPADRGSRASPLLAVADAGPAASFASAGGGSPGAGGGRVATADGAAPAGDAGGGGSSAGGGGPEADGTDGLVFFVPEGDACVIAQPMDGSCLFHSLSCVIDDGSDASSLRAEISGYIAANPDVEVAGTSLKDWIRFDSGGLKVAAYAAEMAGGTWGGGIEIEALARLRGVSVQVFESCPGGYRRICRFDAGSRALRTLSLLYKGREHYDALLLLEGAGRWVLRDAASPLPTAPGGGGGGGGGGSRAHAYAMS